MLQPANIPLRADRNVLFRRTLAFVDFDFTGATFKAAIKPTPDADGPALVSLTTQTTDVQGVRLSYAGTDIIANHLSAGRLSQANVTALLKQINSATGARFVATDSILLSIVALKIDKATMTNTSIFPLPDERGEDVAYAWDILIAPSGGDEDKYAGGAFVIQGGEAV
jgi:hypothetical protein